MSGERLDILIFGATGFTGKWAVLNAGNVLQGLRWGVAGRSKDKLENVLKEIATKTNTDLSSIPIVIADVSNGSSLEEMANKCKVLINCCGPYDIYGEPVVRACIAAGTHHLDISAEPEYIEDVQLKYHRVAAEKNVYVISACGFDSIPADMGLVYLQQNFNGLLNSMEIFERFSAEGFEKYKGAILHTGTWETVVNSMGNTSKVRELRRKLFPEPLPKLEPKLKVSSILCRTNVVGGMSVMFPGPDLDVIQRSQRYLYETKNQRPVQATAYMNFKSRLTGIAFVFFAGFLSFMTLFGCGRRLLIKHPKFFSFGYFSHEGPTEEYMNAVRFEMYMKGTGWSANAISVDSSNQKGTPLDKTLIVKVSGTNPAYGAASIMLLCTAVTIIKDYDKMPESGGVLPPGAAFYNTGLIPLMQKHGLEFKVITNDTNININ